MSCLGKEPLSCNYRLCVTGSTTMHYKIVFATLAVLIGNEFVSAQQIPSTTTAAEMWNPWTWFWPYAIASAEAYRDYYNKAQKATNELYQQIYKTNAFPWVTGNWGLPQVNPSGGSGGSGQNNPSGSGGQNNPTGGSGGQNNPTGGSGGQNNPTGGSGGSGTSGQSNTTGGTGGSGTSGQSNTTGGTGGSGTSGQSNTTGGTGGSGQTDTTGGSGSSGQKDSTTSNGGSTDAKVEGSV